MGKQFGTPKESCCFEVQKAHVKHQGIKLVFRMYGVGNINKQQTKREK